jgi:hypothetical protein
MCCFKSEQSMRYATKEGKTRQSQYLMMIGEAVGLVGSWQVIRSSIYAPV